MSVRPEIVSAHLDDSWFCPSCGRKECLMRLKWRLYDTDGKVMASGRKYAATVCRECRWIGNITDRSEYVLRVHGDIFKQIRQEPRP